MALEGLILSMMSVVLGAVGVYFAVEHWMDRKRLATQAISWDYCFLVAEDLRKKIRRWNPDLVLGIGRSGGIWGGWMAGNLGSKPFAVIDDKYMKDEVSFPGGALLLQAIRATYPEAEKVLLIEGASTRGTTIRKFREEFSDLLEGWDARFAVLFAATTSNAEIQFVGREGPAQWPAEMPWHAQKNWIRAMGRKDA